MKRSCPRHDHIRRATLSRGEVIRRYGRGFLCIAQKSDCVPQFLGTGKRKAYCCFAIHELALRTGWAYPFDDTRQEI